MQCVAEFLSTGRTALSLSLCLLLLTSCESRVQDQLSESVPSLTMQPAGSVDEARLLAADAEPHHWLTSGRDLKQQQFSPLDLINTGNVHRLGFAWEYAITHRGRVKHMLEATPLVIDGVLYTSGPWGTVFSVDARTGGEIWRYDPDVDGNYARRACCGVVNRGVAVWKGSVYVGTLDGYLVALDAAKGRELWKIDTFENRSAFYTITSAPWIAGDKVVIGNSGAEMGVRGYISAYDLETGAFAWRFYIVPGDPSKGYEHPELEIAARTWSRDSEWEAGGGGTAWGHMAYDPYLNLLYVGTGNGSPWPVWHRSPGGGENLFLSSILAINPDNGRLVWYYQTTPGDSWDYAATQHMILGELRIKNRMRKVLMQAPKNGFFYVLDRETGELLSANNYSNINWASRIDMRTGRPVLTERSNYRQQPKVLSPAPPGAHNWQPMSFSPRTGLVYLPVSDARALYVNNREYRHDPKGWSTGAEELYLPLPETYANYAKDFEGDPFGQGRLVAWDPVSQRAEWSTAPGNYGKSGVLSTGGSLVFQGTWDGHFHAYDARTGESLIDLNVGTGIFAAPMSFALDGEQYVAVMAGGYSQDYRPGGRIIAFKLGGGNVPLPPPASKAIIPEPPPMQGTEQQREHGKTVYERYCNRCHNAGDNYYPDLTSMHITGHQLFNRIVLEGLFSDGGMADFSDTLTEDDVEAIHAYLISEQHKYKVGSHN